MGDALAIPGGSREVRRPAPTARVVCGACDGTGRGVDRFGRASVCGTCEGQGRYWVDGYTWEHTAAPGSVVPAPEVVTFRRRVGCAWCQDGDRGRWDAGRGTWVSFGRRFEALPRGSGVRAGVRCEGCDGSGWVWVSAELEVPSMARGGDGDSVAWRIRGSYAELARALGMLRLWRPRCYRELLERGTRGEWPIQDGWAPTGLSYVAKHMPGRIVVAGDVLVAWRDRERRADMIRGPRRDRRLRELAAQGVPVGELARRAGLSESQVRRIAYRET